MSHRHICVHGHFDQPPRENPWTGSVDREATAAPFHDWNARVAEYCYGPITLDARVGSNGRTIAYDETLKRLSYDFGPALLSWLERERPTILNRILAADAATQTAVATPYFHIILPLASRRDKETLVRWGLAAFRHRFGRTAKGMWLPETAVNNETLEVLAGEGVEFTFLDPKQGAAVRSSGSTAWTEITAEHIDPKTPYLWVSPSDPSKKIAIFFHHRGLSHGVVTGKTTVDAAGFAVAANTSLMPGDAAQLVHVASNGEFYGHYHQDAGRVLTLTLDLLEADGITTIDPARFLILFPPPRQIKIRENTAWSCEHGLGRWEKDCGCRSAQSSDWNQEWRAGMRGSLTELARHLDSFYEDDALRFFANPWEVRDKSAALWLAPDDGRVSAFLKAHAKRPLLAAEEQHALMLLTMQRERLAMFASSGWFFDDISSIETVLCLTRAARALDLAKQCGLDAEDAFVERLSACRSNLPRYKNGGAIWKTLVGSARVSLERAAVHAALLDHLDLPAPEPRLLRWTVDSAFRAEKAGFAGRDRTLSIRTVSVRRTETREDAEFHAVVHRTDRLDVACWLSPRKEPLDRTSVANQFLRLTDDEFRAAMDGLFDSSSSGLDAVLSDERSEVVKVLSTADASGGSRSVFLKRWVECIAAVRRGGDEDDVLIQLLSEAAAHSFNAHELPWAWELESRLHQRMEKLISAPEDAKSMSRTLRWLDALWDAGLLSGIWRLRDAQCRWARALESRGPCSALDACRALGARLGLAETSLEAVQ